MLLAMSLYEDTTLPWELILMAISYESQHIRVYDPPRSSDFLLDTLLLGQDQSRVKRVQLGHYLLEQYIESKTITDLQSGHREHVNSEVKDGLSTKLVTDSFVWTSTQGRVITTAKGNFYPFNWIDPYSCSSHEIQRTGVSLRHQAVGVWWDAKVGDSTTWAIGHSDPATQASLIYLQAIAPQQETLVEFPSGKQYHLPFYMGMCECERVEHGWIVAAGCVRSENKKTGIVLIELDDNENVCFGAHYPLHKPCTYRILANRFIEVISSDSVILLDGFASDNSEPIFSTQSSFSHFRGVAELSPGYYTDEKACKIVQLFD